MQAIAEVPMQKGALPYLYMGPCSKYPALFKACGYDRAVSTTFCDRSLDLYPEPEALKPESSAPEKSAAGACNKTLNPKYPTALHPKT